ncbi:hypothetical protein N9A94_05700, partial [Akkermansiaceae bacterium]|nr:hypothetical protein [Akkermansiaceae bacterium]MDB4537612.1 hypothetical protein [Akkermansiaceae bacterium]
KTPTCCGKPTSSQIQSDSAERSRSIRKKRNNQHLSVNYSFLEQGLQVSLPKLYGDFILDLDLSPYENRYFESLLVERLLAQQQFGMEVMAGNKNDRLVSINTIEKRLTENNSRIKQFLNHPEDYSDFVKFEKQLPERRNLGVIRSLFSPLTLETEEHLIEILYQCRIEAEGELPIWKSMLADEDIETKQEYWRRSDESLAILLPTVLPRNQAQNFLAQWQTIRSKHYNIAFSLFHRDG